MEQKCPICGDTMFFVVFELKDGSKEISHGSCISCKYTDNIKRIIRPEKKEEKELAS